MIAAKQRNNVSLLASSTLSLLLCLSFFAATCGAEEVATTAAALTPTEAACLYTRSISGSTDTLCIRKDSFNRDLCGAIERTADDHDLPPDFFARLIWRESRFRPDALSYKGAQGIAQFMPGTAKLRGLQDSYDVLEALQKSAEYLDELRDRFGNLGLAAAAYNAGENGLANFLNGGRLPTETRSYVMAITAHSVEEWKSDAPDQAAGPLAKDQPFVESCVALADRRKMVEPPWRTEGNWAPWGVQMVANANPDVARRLFFEAVSQLPAPLDQEQPLIMRQRDRSFGFRPRYVTRIPRQTRAEANDVCKQIRKASQTCLVFKN
ncbi:lytic transglycosylase domain-containing protein [Rhizobium sp. 18055]|uniref:lytic transglycosylase domain-containing protein n=1 Tax=Rhizobium sp. 18055 TaxID=2681403 RepID=UPI0013590208|nr:lytic transglycosylase domain-containing protein [Rhizobium sp. 18055]